MYKGLSTVPCAQGRLSEEFAIISILQMKKRPRQAGVCVYSQLTPGPCFLLQPAGIKGTSGGRKPNLVLSTRLQEEPPGVLSG